MYFIRSLDMKTLMAIVLLCIASAASAQWSYRSTNDEMRGTKTKLAKLNSINRVQLAFPYHGGSRLQLIIRKESDANVDVFFWIEKGQLLCHSICRIYVKFDNEGVEDWEALGADSGESDTIFIYRGRADNFLDRLEMAKKLTVEVQIYDYGRAKFVFNSKGLKW
jgi:hypothetical protein